jgi:2-dehydro-3-deoxyphosphogluconate aldolase/(4S)-4-hydroxy-2-oxoglutarate aldolase
VRLAARSTDSILFLRCLQENPVVASAESLVSAITPWVRVFVIDASHPSGAHIDPLLSALARLPAIGILRGCAPRHVEAVVSSAANAGFTAIEVTFDSPDTLESLRRLVARFADLAVGAGTVRTPLEVEQAADVGATFIVSPIVDEHVISEAIARGVTMVPGAATPTEVSRALAAGADAVKLFPAAQLGGPAYVRAIRAPLGNPRLVPTGGVTKTNARAFLDAGAFALGVGGSVFPRDALSDGDSERVGSLALAFTGSLR